MSRLDEFVSRLDKARFTGHGHGIARCPAHDDRMPSLTFREGDDGRVLVHCFGGCSVEQVVAAVGLTLSDIMPEGPLDVLPNKRSRIPARDVLEAMAFSALVVAIMASHMAQGKQLSEEEKDKLFAIAGEFQEAIEYATRRES